MFKNKSIAFLTHLLLSLVVVSLVMGLIVYFWYPTDYLNLTRFKEIALILICVDIVMGPILTFIVYNPDKASIRFDLAVIGVLQLTALGYGCYALYQNHPLYITFTVDRFTIVTAQDARPETAKFDEYKISKISPPKLAFADLPETVEQRNALMLGVISGEPDLDRRIDLYKPYTKNIPTVAHRSLDAKKIFSNTKNAPVTAEYLNKFRKTNSDNIFFPITGPVKHAILAINKLTGKPVAVINIEPWKFTRKQLL